MTLFTNYLTFDQLDFPWTCFLIDKWKGLIKLCLIFIYELKEKLLKCDLGGLSELLKEDTNKYHNFSKKKNTLSSLNNNNTLVKEEESSLFAKGYYDMTKSLSTSRRDNSFKKIVSLKLNENEKNYDKNISVVNIRNKILSIDRKSVV